MPDAKPSDQERLAAFWDDLVRGAPRQHDDIDPETVRLVTHLHDLYRPSAPGTAFREHLRKDLLMTAVTSSILASPSLPVSPALSRSPNGTFPGAPGKSPAARWLTRGSVESLAAMMVLILALAAISLPVIAARLGWPDDGRVMLSALLHSEQATPAVQEITGGADPLTLPTGVAVDADGTLYVVDGPRDQVRVFNPDGTPKATWGTSGVGPGEFAFSSDTAWGDLAVGPDGDLYVLDSSLGRVQKFTPEGEVLFEFAELGSGEGQLLAPLGIGIGSNGQVYVADWGNHRVQVFAGDGTFLAAWDGTQGGGPPLAGPRDVAIDASGVAWVTDEIMQRVTGFGPDGTVVGSFGKIGSDPGEVRGPWGIAVDAAGEIYVVDHENDRVQVFAPDGELLGVIGATGDGLGEFEAPFYPAIGPDGALYVADETGRVQKFAAPAGTAKGSDYGAGARVAATGAMRQSSWWTTSR
ncbi:MAG: NHL repeat-containing protein [Thermomicrobiales bacterium]|nr:NHL repeat-containing protein [Thermomicrobiales bacterium]